MEGTPRDHCVQPPCKTGCLQQAAQVGVHAALEYLQTRRSHSLAGQPVPQLCHPHREEVPSHAGAELPVLQLTAISPCLRPRRAPLPVPGPLSRTPPARRSCPQHSLPLCRGFRLAAARTARAAAEVSRASNSRLPTAAPARGGSANRSRRSCRGPTRPRRRGGEVLTLTNEKQGAVLPLTNERQGAVLPATNERQGAGQRCR